MEHDYVAQEARARANIDAQLVAAGWQVQSAARANVAAGIGVAVREFVLEKGTVPTRGSTPSTDPDGDSLGKDLYRRQPLLPTHQACRCYTHPLPDGQHGIQLKT